MQPNPDPPVAPSFWLANYFPSLDGLRALSLVLVIGGHLRTTVPLRQYVNGGLGVGIFFVLSGFLITTLLLREAAAQGAFSFRGFYVRRLFRIVPPYALTLLIYWLVGMLPSQNALHAKFARGLPYFLTLRNEYVPAGIDVCFTHSWSLSVEEKFYLVWPVLLFFLLRYPQSKWALVPLTLAPLLISPARTLPVAYFALLLGSCLAWCLDKARVSPQKLLDIANNMPTTLVAGLWLLSYLVSLVPALRIAFIVVTAAVVAFLVLRSSWLSNLLGSRIATWVGRRSYSMYLFHAFCLSAVEDHLLRPSTVGRYLAATIICYLATLSVASAVYIILEKPSISFGRTLSKRLSPSRRQPRSEIRTAIAVST